MSRINHIIVMRLSAMGDVAMTVPVIRALIQQNPEVKVTVVSRPFFKPFFEDIPNVKFFSIDLKKRHKGFLGLFRLFFDLNKLNVDAFADLHNVLRSKVVKTLFSIKGTPVASVDKGRVEKKELTRSKNKIFKPLTTMIERHVEVFKSLGVVVDMKDPVFPPRSKIDKTTTTIIGVKDKKWIGIAPFAQYTSKVYPLDLMEKVIALLAENRNYKLFLFGGGEKEILLLEKLSVNRENVVNIAGKITFKEEIELISNLDVILSMDSGNAHIGAMLGIEVVTVWGATHPYAGFAPFNQPEENTITVDREKYPMLPTSIYGNKEVPGYQDVMRTIKPEYIVAVIQSKL